MSMFKIIGGAVAVSVAEKVIVTIIDIIRDEFESKQTVKTTKDMESKIDRDSQHLKNKMEALLEDLKVWERSKQDEIQLLIAELEKKGMREEKQRARALKTSLRKNVRQLSRKINTLKEDVEEWPEIIMLDLQSRVELMNIKGKKKKENIALALENMLKKNRRMFSQKMETLKEDVDECLETIEDEIQILRDALEEMNEGWMRQSA